MADNPIKLVNESGRIVGKDPDTGDTVPVEFETLQAEEISIGPGCETAHPDDNTDGIQQAIQDLPSSGGVVRLLEGTYEVSSGAEYPGNAILVLKDNVAIIGQGRNTIIKVPDNYTPTDDGQKVIDLGASAGDDGNNVIDSQTSITRANGCLLANFKIDGNYQNQGNINDDDDGHNIEIHGKDNKVVNVWSVNATGDGVELTAYSSPSQVEDCLVMGCTFRDCWEQNVHLHGAKNARIIGNYMDGEINNASVHFASGNSDTSGCIVAHNHILNSSQQGIVVAAGSPNSSFMARDNQILNNFIKGHSKTGFEVDSRTAKNTVIRGNCITECSGGISVNYGADVAEIKNNYIYKNDGSGITLRSATDGDGDGGALQDVLVESNHIRENNQSESSGAGVTIKADGEDITRITIWRNEIIGAGSGAGAHDGAFNFKEESSGGSYSSIAVIGNEHRQNKQPDFNNQQLSLDHLRNNIPPIAIDVQNLAADFGNYAFHNGSGSGEKGYAYYEGGTDEWYYHGGVTESAANDSPQDSYAPGQIVYFTDSDDGSGTGTYIIDDSGTAQGPI